MRFSLSWVFQLSARSLTFGAAAFFANATAAADISPTRAGLNALVEMPTAFTAPDAETAITLSFDSEVQAVSLGFQTLPRLETSLSFTTYKDVFGGGSDDETALNLKFRLADEGALMPAVAVGVTNAFANERGTGEYLVASKALTSSLRATVGVGWGRFGGYTAPGAVFADRPQSVPTRRGAFGHLFAGQAGYFGGLEWETPIEGLRLAAEYSSDRFANETFAPESRFNFAAHYRVAEGLDITAFQRGGETLGVALTLSANPTRPLFPPDLGAPPPLFTPRPTAGRNNAGWATDANVAAALQRAAEERLGEASIQLVGFSAASNVLSVGVATRGTAAIPNVVGRTARILSGVAPASVEAFNITVFERGVATTTFLVPRDGIQTLENTPGRGAESRTLIATRNEVRRAEEYDWVRPFEGGFSWSATPAVALAIDSTGGFEPELALFAQGRYDFSRSFYASGTLSYQLAGGGSGAAPPATPSVRSDASAYDQRSVRLDRLFAAHIAKPAPALHSRLAFGILERQYAGASAEILWTPDATNWALGGEVTYARKRDYDDAFGVLDLDAVTGHVSLYWNTGFKGLGAQVDVGRYLAGDWGTTLTVSRSFANGWDVATFATLTEDNRDEKVKIGAHVEIPFSTLAPIETRRKSTLRLGGNFGDAGARVATPDRLITRVRRANARRVDDAWGTFWK